MRTSSAAHWASSARRIFDRVMRNGGEGEYEANAKAHERLTRELALTGLVGRHPAFLHTTEQIPAVARCSTPVLITGETGTGKELCARAIHHLEHMADLLAAAHSLNPVSGNFREARAHAVTTFERTWGDLLDAHRSKAIPARPYELSGSR
jgi:hypothetical protein